MLGKLGFPKFSIVIALCVEEDVYYVLYISYYILYILCVCVWTVSNVDVKLRCTSCCPTMQENDVQNKKPTCKTKTYTLPTCTSCKHRISALYESNSRSKLARLYDHDNTHGGA